MNIDETKLIIVLELLCKHCQSKTDYYVQIQTLIDDIKNGNFIKTFATPLPPAAAGKNINGVV